jgi:hypothetical protein
MDRGDRIDLLRREPVRIPAGDASSGADIVCASFGKVGYSYACITLVIIVLIPRADMPWIAAAHRFAEVSLGILVALAVVAIWRGSGGSSVTLPPNSASYSEA